MAWSLAEHERGRGAACELVFFDDALPAGPLASGLGNIVGPLDALPDHADRRGTLLVLGVGLPHLKARLTERLAPTGLAWATVIHPRAVIGPNVEIGPGSYVAAGAIVTVNVRLDAFVTINMHAQVAHDGVIGRYATLHPNAHVAGNVEVGEGAELGTGAAVIPGCTIGPWAVLGAGAVAIESLEGDRTYGRRPGGSHPAPRRRARLRSPSVSPERRRPARTRWPLRPNAMSSLKASPGLGGSRTSQRRNWVARRLA